MGFSSDSLARAAFLRSRAALRLSRAADGQRGGYLLLHRARALELEAAFSLPAVRCLELNDWCGTLVEAAAEVCPLPPSSLRFSGWGEPLPVAGRPALLEAVILQAVCNSLLYAGPCPGMELRLRAVGGRACLFYLDSGPGLAGDIRQGFGFGAARAFARQAGGSFAVRAGGPGFVCALSLPLRSDLPPLPAPRAAELWEDRFSPLYIHLAPRCILPE